jgi:hypothetical protein
MKILKVPDTMSKMVWNFLRYPIPDQHWLEPATIKIRNVFLEFPKE